MFIAKNGDLIVLARETEEELLQGLKLMNYDVIEETETNYILSNGKYVTQSEFEQEEQEKINKLTMTALDFIGVLQNFGLTLEQINAYLESHLDVKMQLTYCQNVYCGIVKSFMPITFGDITITADMVEMAFKLKYGMIEVEENTAETEETADEQENTEADVE